VFFQFLTPHKIPDQNDLFLLKEAYLRKYLQNMITRISKKMNLWLFYNQRMEKTNITTEMTGHATSNL